MSDGDAEEYPDRIVTTTWSRLRLFYKDTSKGFSLTFRTSTGS